MTQDEFTELKASVEAVAMQDVHLGRVLHALVAHMGNLAGVDTAPAPVEEAPAEEAPAQAPVEEPSA